AQIAADLRVRDQRGPTRYRQQARLPQSGCVLRPEEARPRRPVPGLSDITRSGGPESIASPFPQSGALAALDLFALAEGFAEESDFSVFSLLSALSALSAFSPFSVLSFWASGGPPSPFASFCWPFFA